MQQRKLRPEEIEEEKNKNLVNYESMHNTEYPLDEFLLYFVFSRNTSEKMRN